MESIHHYCQLICSRFTNRRFGCPWLRSMRQPERMQRDVATVDAFARHEIAFGVIDHFIGLDVGVVVRSRDRVGMEIIEARHERAQHEVPTLEGLVRWWRHMQKPDTRFEIVDAEYPRIQEPIPTYDVMRVMIEDMTADCVAHFHPHLEFATVGVNIQLVGHADITLGVWCML